jgi:hypothetical protein
VNLRSAHFETVCVLVMTMYACSDSEDDSKLGVHEEGLTVLVGAEDEETVFDTPSGGDCIEVADDVCVKPQDRCGDKSRTDVVVSSTGQVIEVVCYGHPNTVDVVLPDDAVTEVTLGNNEALLIDDHDDGPDVTGNVFVDGNNAIVYGSSPATSIIGRDLVIAKNNVSVRNVTVAGNVVVDGNNAALVHCVVAGDLILNGNNAVVADCTVFGNVFINTNNTRFVGNLVQVAPVVTGNNTMCDGNVAFTDANDDGVVADDEVGDPFVCP